ncbi:MAG TPA: M67 family metallopeptidase [Nitrosopumilaceae archaeon]|nr:M67 family metallopeptidase [Nitrosopumilaceae archaeon]
MQKSIVITKAQKELLLEHASNYNPNESCAILFGVNENEKSTVKDVFLAENIDESPVNFTISNEELLKAYQIAEKKNLDIVGIFHSHPSADAFPSSTDKKFMHANPVVWIISSGKSSELKAFLLEPDIIEIPIVIS